MKKYLSVLFMTLTLLPALAACGGYDYTKHLSEVRSDLFCAETEEFSLTFACISREYPYSLDGIAAPKSNVAEITIISAQKSSENFTVTVLGGEKEWGGETSYRNTRGDYFYSQGVKEFPEGSVSLRVQWGENVKEIAATSVKNEKTSSPESALKHALEAERDAVKNLMQNGCFMGEFHVRLLRRDANYYYVGIVDGKGHTISLLLDSETGETLARRESD